MPEIPELEAATAALNARLAGRVIEAARLGLATRAAESGPCPAAAGRPRDIASLDRPSAGEYLKHTERTFFARLVAE